MEFDFDMNTDDSIEDFDIVDLDEDGYFGETKYLGIPVIICKKNNKKKDYKKGYINATKFCAIANKEFKSWVKNVAAISIISETANLLGLNVDDMTFHLRHKVLKCRGTYVHPKLVATIACWCSFEFTAALSALADRCQHHISRYHETIDNKIDESSSLEENEFSKIRFLGEKRPIGCVYVFTDDRYYKIELSMDVVERKSTLLTGNPNELKTVLKVIVVDPAKVETILLEKFSKNIVRGEWFDLDEDDLRKLEEILEENRN